MGKAAIESRLQSLDWNLADTPYRDFAGTESSRTAVANYLQDISGQSVDPNHVVIGNGLVSVLEAISIAILDAGDHVLVTTPVFPGLITALTSRTEASFVPLETTADEQFQLSPSALTEKLEFERTQGRRVKAVLLCSPGNPIGQVFTATEVQQFVKIAEDFNVALIVDEIYASSCFDGVDFVSALTANSDHVITIGGLSKDFGLAGYTGVGLATVGAAKGYKVVLTMSEAMSEERKMVLRGLGATVVETPVDQGTGGAIAVAQQMVADNPGKYWLAGQHSSHANPLAHYKTTAVEILQQVPDITHFVAGIGTFGTLRGAGQRLREEVGAKIIGLEPELGSPIQGLRNMNEPNSPKLYDESLLDNKANVEDPLWLFNSSQPRKSAAKMLVEWKALLNSTFESEQPLKRAMVAVAMLRTFPDRPDLAVAFAKLLADEEVSPQVRNAGLVGLEELLSEKIKPVAGMLLAVGKQSGPTKDRMKTWIRSIYIAFNPT